MLTILWVTLLMGLVLLLGVLECRTARRTLRSKAKRLDCVSVSDAVEAAATTEENADAPPPPEQHAADGSDERMLLLGFLRAHGWDFMDPPEGYPVQRSLRPPEKRYSTDYYETYWRRRVEEELSAVEEMTLTMIKFDANEVCTCVTGTPWEIVARQLNALLKLNPQPPVTKPPLPVIIKRRQLG